MARSGAVPRGYQSRDRDEKRRGLSNGVNLVWDGVRRGEDLPTVQPWHPLTVKWWNTWRDSAQATVFAPTDWSFLLSTAMLVDSFFMRPHHLIASEIRQRESKMGATLEDRMRLRISVGDVADDEDDLPDGVTAIDDYRDKLTGS